MITFVTSYLFYENHVHINDEFSIDNLIQLCRTNLPLIIFIYHDCESWIREKIRDSIDPDTPMPFLFPIQKTKLRILRTIEEYDYIIELPKNRNVLKDTIDHIWKTHVSIELTDLAVQKNPYNTSHFSWIHYSLPYIIQNPSTFIYLHDLCNMNLRDSCFIFPGCEDTPVTDIPTLLNEICWRFSGGFFIGDRKSITDGYNIYIRELSRFLRTYRKLIWDVNFYAYLESVCRDEWKVTWYPGNHNDSMIQNIPPQCFSRCLANSRTVEIIEYHNLVEMDGLYPSSAAYLQYYDTSAEKILHFLNMRYVNYWLYPNGYYRYSSTEHIIQNKNVLYELDNGLMPIRSSFRIMEDALDLPDFQEAYSRGFEDLRLYVVDDKIKFSATNLNHVDGSGRSRIIVGDYCVDTGTLRNGVVVNPPTETKCEKNWIPIVYQCEECFVYKWSPFQIGKIDTITHNLEIVCERDLKCPLFRNVRGSSVFVEDEKGRFLGVVHFSEEGSPRKYYHMLVEMKDGIPFRYSQPFCFQTLSVEFCIGFAIHRNTYVFWISRMDRDPAIIIVSKDEILCNNNIY